MNARPDPPPLDTIQITNPYKILFPLPGITKRQLVAYYQKIAPTLLPHIIKRPLALQRFIDGIGHNGFFQKNTPDHAPKWIERMPIKNQDGSITSYIVANAIQTLIYLANQDCITLHGWLSTTDHINKPDRLIFDLDPTPAATIDDIRTGALCVKQAAELYELSPFLMLTGKRGVHVTCPIKPTLLFDQVRMAARNIAQALCKQHAELFSCHARKEQRSAKLYIDVMRNAWGQTSVAPYSVRATSHATVATPITWPELSRVRPNSYTIKNIFRRMARIQDPWKSIESHATSIPAPLITQNKSD